MDQVDSIDLEKYATLLTASMENCCYLAIIDQHGKIHRKQITCLAGNQKSIEDFLCSSRIPLDSIECSPKAFWLNETQVLVAKKFDFGGTTKASYLVVAYVAKPEDSRSLIDSKLVKLTDLVGTMISEDIIQQMVVDGMVNEMTNRYEELNLLYGLDPHSVKTKIDDECAYISDTLNKIVNALQIDGAGLVIPEKQIFITAAPSGQTDKVAESEVKSMFGRITPAFNKMGKCLVINSLLDYPGLLTDSEFTKKLLVHKLHADKREDASFFYAYTRIEGDDFSNSDRKLCSIVASELNRIFLLKRDPLTGLINRNSFYKQFSQEISSDFDNEHRDVLVYINLDRFQIINQTFGQKAGDQLLVQISELIKTVVRKNDLAARIGGDEFVIVFKDCDVPLAEQRARKIQNEIESTGFACQGKCLKISTSIGLVSINRDFESVDNVLKAAGISRKLAQQSIGNRIRTYSSKDQNLIDYETDIDWVSRIEQALEENRFLLYCQAIAPAGSAQAPFNHFEILLRMEDESRKIIFPNAFLPAAEQYDLMPQVDRWVVARALTLLGQLGPETEFSINLSGQSLSDDSLCRFLVDEINRSGVNPQQICFEITESIAVANLSEVLKLISTLKVLGCSFSLDDFGTGMSSFSYLKSLPVDVLKIDGAFVKRITNDPIDRAMVEAMSSIAQKMELKTVAEFVEDQESLKILQTIGIDFVQGYGIHKPEPLSNQINLLQFST